MTFSSRCTTRVRSSTRVRRCRVRSRSSRTGVGVRSWAGPGRARPSRDPRRVGHVGLAAGHVVQAPRRRPAPPERHLDRRPGLDTLEHGVRAVPARRGREANPVLAYGAGRAVSPYGSARSVPSEVLGAPTTCSSIRSVSVGRPVPAVVMGSCCGHEVELAEQPGQRGGGVAGVLTGLDQGPVQHGHAPALPGAAADRGWRAPRRTASGPVCRSAQGSGGRRCRRSDRRGQAVALGLHPHVGQAHRLLLSSSNGACTCLTDRTTYSRPSTSSGSCNPASL